MLATFKRALRKDRKPGEERLTSGNKIAAMLRQLKAGHALLSACVPGCKDRANTAILGIKEANGTFYLDELSADCAHQALLSKRKARFDCRLNGMELQFTSRLRKASKSNGIAVYEMLMPKALTRVQRRENFRLRLSPGLTVPVTIPSLEGEAVSGQAFDLSSTGLGLFLKTRNVPSRGQVLAGVALSLPGLKPMKAKLEVRFARQDGAHHMLRLGARFVGLDAKQQRQIALFLAEQQRKRRRYEPR